MDTPEKPRKPWWRKMRWAAAFWLALPVIYVAGFCPGAYCVGRGWIGHIDFEDVYRPLFRSCVRKGWFPPLEDIFYYCRDAGYRVTLSQPEPYSARQRYYLGERQEPPRPE